MAPVRSPHCGSSACQLGVGRRRRDAVLQPADRDTGSGCRGSGGWPGRGRAGSQHLDVVVHHVELRRHDADHLAAHAVEVHGLAEHRPAAERRLPQLVRQDRQLRAVGVGLARREQPPLGRRDAQRGEQVVGDRGAAHAHRTLAGHQVELAGRERARPRRTTGSARGTRRTRAARPRTGRSPWPGSGWSGTSAAAAAGRAAGAAARR